MTPTPECKFCHNIAQPGKSLCETCEENIRVQQEIADDEAYYDDEEDYDYGCECPTCAGFGYVSKADYYKDWINYMNVEIECPDCHGSGYVENPTYQ